MKKYEYKVLDVPTKLSWFGGKVDLQLLSNKLNSLGREGWEVTNSTSLNQYNGASRGLVIILKRETN